MTDIAVTVNESVEVVGEITVTALEVTGLETRGAAGVGVPAGGDTDQVLGKLSGTDFDTGWIDQTGGGAGVSDGDKGDITVSSSGTVWTVDNDAITNAKAANMAQATIKGRASGAGTGDPTDLTAAQTRTILNVADGATANSADATLLARANHTGTQTLATISDVTASAAEVNVLDGVTASTAELNYTDGVTSAIQTQLDAKVDENAAIVGATKTKITYDAKGLVTAGADATKSDVGLGNVDNTSDANKPVSTATQTALDLKANAANPTFTGTVTVPDGALAIADTSGLQTALDAKAADADVVHDTGNETIAGVKTFSSDPIIPDEAYGSGFNGVLEPVTKNAVYDALVTNGKGWVNHGSTAGTARPVGFATVEWYGTVEPDNAIEGDTWNDPS